MQPDITQGKLNKYNNRISDTYFNVELQEGHFVIVLQSVI